MGFKHAFVLGPVSFTLGILFLCFNVDYALLFTDFTKETIADAFQFYTTFYNAPPAIKALLHGLIGIGIFGLIAKLHKWDDSAMFFDGTSLGSYVFAIAVYVSVIIPTLRTVAVPAKDDTYEDRVEAVRVLSAGNVIISLSLVAILLLQAGQEYAKRSEEKALAAAAVAGPTEDQHKPTVSDVNLKKKKKQ